MSGRHTASWRAEKSMLALGAPSTASLLQITVGAAGTASAALCPRRKNGLRLTNAVPQLGAQLGGHTLIRGGHAGKKINETAHGLSQTFARQALGRRKHEGKGARGDGGMSLPVSLGPLAAVQTALHHPAYLLLMLLAAFRRIFGLENGKQLAADKTFALGDFWTLIATFLLHVSPRNLRLVNFFTAPPGTPARAATEA